jgi:hypothetical protein
MATYKEIHGIKVQYRDSDPTAVEGDVWYNASTAKLKMYAAVGSWSSGGNLNTGLAGCAGFGIQTASLKCTGEIGPVTVNVEQYDGSSWTEIANVNTAGGNITGAGTVTAGVIFNRSESKQACEEWDGSSWTEVNDTNVATALRAGLGIQTAAIGAGGDSHPSIEDSVESYDGTTWTEVGDLNTGRCHHNGGTGTQTAAILGSGTTTPAQTNYTAVSEEWDGSSWTEGNDVNTSRAHSGTGGIQTNAIMAGGGVSTIYAVVEAYDGTSWSEVADLSTGRYKMGGSGTGSLALVFAGYDPGNSITTATEEWNMSASVETIAFD